MGDMDQTEKRQFIRHAASIPIACRAEDGEFNPGDMLNISYGGLAFNTTASFEPGQIISIRITFRNAEHTLTSRVAWCEAKAPGYNLGVEFLNRQDRFKTRLIEQICYIEEYRKEKEAEGKVLSTTEAAREWISKYSEKFPW